MVLTIYKNELHKIDNAESNNKLKRREENVSVSIEPNPSTQFERGTLYVHEDFLGFYSIESQTGFKIDYPSVVIHALALNQQLNKPMLYCQISKMFEELLPNGNERQEYDPMTELKFTFHNLDNDEIYLAINSLQALYPDENQPSEDEFTYADNHNFSDADEDQEIRDANTDFILRALERGSVEQEEEEEEEDKEN